MWVMSASDMVRHSDHLTLLRGGVRGALPRQQSLAATIDWSYRLLTESERALFTRLSVFAGSFDLEAAHEVCGVDGDRQDNTLELLAGLVDKSMVVVRSATDQIGDMCSSKALLTGHIAPQASTTTNSRSSLSLT